MAPTPKTESMMPTPAGPVSRISTANVTPETIVAPATTVCAHTRTATIIRSRSRRMCRKPPAISANAPTTSSGPPEPRSPSSSAGSSSPGVGPAIGRMPHTRNADSTKVAALSRNTTSTLVVVTRRAPRAGPTKKARLSMVLEVPLAAVSSSGREVSDGIHAIWAGRKTQPTTESRVATTSTAPTGAPVTRQAVATTASPARSRSLPMSTVLRATGRRARSRSATRTP